MPKKYKLLIDSPELHNGAVAELQEKEEVYKVVFSRGAHYLSPEQVENRPTVWQEIVEEPEKKIVERWRAENGFPAYTLTGSFDDENNIGSDLGYYQRGNYFQSSEAATRARQRVEIMCRLMGLAETIEEGSTEMKGGYMLVSNDGNLYITHSYITYMSSMRLATFSTEKLAQLFLDSAGQDALDWYGAVK